MKFSKLVFKYKGTDITDKPLQLIKENSKSLAAGLT